MLSAFEIVTVLAKFPSVRVSAPATEIDQAIRNLQLRR